MNVEKGEAAQRGSTSYDEAVRRSSAPGTHIRHVLKEKKSKSTIEFYKIALLIK